MSTLSARRALLRQQAEILGADLSWLTDPDGIPAGALGDQSEKADVHEQCFSLATWVVREIFWAASEIQHRLQWSDTFERHGVPSELRSALRRAVLEPVTRYGPGIIALSEIVAVTPVVATRLSVPRSEWGRIARRSEHFGARFSQDGTNVQMLIRNYLRLPAGAANSPVRRVLDPALLRLDDEMGLTSVTPIDDLVAFARRAVERHLGPARGICVAMQALAPASDQAPASGQTIYSAIWRAYATAAERLIFPGFEEGSVEIPAQAGLDPHAAEALDRIARQRAAMR